MQKQQEISLKREYDEKEDPRLGRLQKEIYSVLQEKKQTSLEDLVDCLHLTYGGRPYFTPSGRVRFTPILKSHLRSEVSTSLTKLVEIGILNFQAVHRYGKKN